MSLYDFDRQRRQERILLDGGRFPLGLPRMCTRWCQTVSHIARLPRKTFRNSTKSAYELVCPLLVSTGYGPKNRVFSEHCLFVICRQQLCALGTDCASVDNDGVNGSVRPLNIPTPRGRWTRDRNAFCWPHHLLIFWQDNRSIQTDMSSTTMETTGTRCHGLRAVILKRGMRIALKKSSTTSRRSLIPRVTQLYSIPRLNIETKS